MASLDVSASARVAVKPEALWDLVCDTARLSEWVAGTEAVTHSDGPARLGSTYGELNPILGPWKAKTDWAVIEFDAPRRQVHRTTDIPLAREFLVITEVEASGDGSKVTITLQGTSSHGLLGGALFAALRSQTRRDNARSLAGLAALATTELTDSGALLATGGHRPRPNGQ